MACVSSEDSDQPGLPPILISLRCPHEESIVLSYPLNAQWRLWSDWVDAQADRSLRWAHSHFVGFVMRWLNFLWPNLQIEAGEGVETAINQMKQEKEQLIEKLSALENSLQTQSEENTKMVEDLYRQLNEVKGQLETSEASCNKLQTSMTKKKEKLSANTLKIQELETSLKSKVSIVKK